MVRPSSTQLHSADKIEFPSPIESLTKSWHASSSLIHFVRKYLKRKLLSTLKLVFFLYFVGSLWEGQNYLYLIHKKQWWAQTQETQTQEHKHKHKHKHKNTRNSDEHKISFEYSNIWIKWHSNILRICIHAISPVQIYSDIHL